MIEGRAKLTISEVVNVELEGDIAGRAPAIDAVLKNAFKNLTQRL